MTRLPGAASLAAMIAARSPEIAAVDLARCDRCGLCLPLCPPAAIRLGSVDLLIDAGACTGCRKCIAPCPVGALRMGLRG